VHYGWLRPCNARLLLEGDAGVGKTSIAAASARMEGRKLIRLQCYEGLDLQQAVYEWNYSRQLLEIQKSGAGKPSGGKPSTSSTAVSCLSARCSRRSARPAGGIG